MSASFFSPARHTIRAVLVQDSRHIIEDTPFVIAFEDAHFERAQLFLDEPTLRQLASRASALVAVLDAEKAKRQEPAHA